MSDAALLKAANVMANDDKYDIQPVVRRKMWELIVALERRQYGGCICIKCGLRQDSNEKVEADF